MAPRKVCGAPYCPERTVARVRDHANTKRVDLCEEHVEAVRKRYGDEVLVERFVEKSSEEDLTSQT